MLTGKKNIFLNTHAYVVSLQREYLDLWLLVRGEAVQLVRPPVPLDGVQLVILHIKNNYLNYLSIFLKLFCGKLACKLYEQFSATSCPLRTVGGMLTKRLLRPLLEGTGKKKGKNI